MSRLIGAGSGLAAGPEPAARRKYEANFVTRLSLWLILAILLILVGSGVYLAFWNIPAPSAVVEKTLSDDRFPK